MPPYVLISGGLLTNARRVQAQDLLQETVELAHLPERGFRPALLREDAVDLLAQDPHVLRGCGEMVEGEHERLIPREVRPCSVFADDEAYGRHTTVGECSAPKLIHSMRRARFSDCRATPVALSKHHWSASSCLSYSAPRKRTRCKSEKTRTGVGAPAFPESLLAASRCSITGWRWTATRFAHLRAFPSRRDTALHHSAPSSPPEGARWMLGTHGFNHSGQDLTMMTSLMNSLAKLIASSR